MHEPQMGIGFARFVVFLIAGTGEHSPPVLDSPDVEIVAKDGHGVVQHGNTGSGNAGRPVSLRPTGGAGMTGTISNSSATMRAVLIPAEMPCFLFEACREPAP